MSEAKGDATTRIQEAAAEVQWVATLEAVVLRAKACPECAHPNPYLGQYPDGGYPSACLECGASLVGVEAVSEDMGELARSEPFTLEPGDEPAPPPGFLDQLSDAWRRGWQKGDVS